MSGTIWVLVEHRDGVARRVSFEAIGLANEIASSKGWDVAALVLGEGTTAIVGEVARLGVSKVLHAEHSDLKNFTAESYAGAIAGQIGDDPPRAILLGATLLGKDLAATLAARLETGLLADVVTLQVEGDDTFVATRPRNAGKVMVTVAAGAGRPQIVSIRPKAFPIALTCETSAPVETVVHASPEGGLKIEYKEFIKSGGDRIGLSEADVVVAGGRGLKGPENFHMIEDLADALGAAVGASRAVVDAGWRDHSEQVGQTGKIVAPKVYVACAISGAIQHLVGMTNAKTVIAINKDADAPIFKRADYGIVGDVLEVLPPLTEAIRKAKEA